MIEDAAYQNCNQPIMYYVPLTPASSAGSPSLPISRPVSQTPTNGSGIMDSTAAGTPTPISISDTAGKRNTNRTPLGHHGGGGHHGKHNRSAATPQSMPSTPLSARPLAHAGVGAAARNPHLFATPPILPNGYAIQMGGGAGSAVSGAAGHHHYDGYGHNGGGSQGDPKSYSNGATGPPSSFSRMQRQHMKES